MQKRSPIRLAALILILLLAFLGREQASAGVLGALLGSGADSGKRAKFQFELRDDMPLTSIGWSPDGRYIAVSTSQGKEIHVWDVQRRRLQARFQRVTGTAVFHTLAWSPDGHLLAVCDNEEGLRLYSVPDWELARVIPAEPSTGCTQPAFSDDGKELAILFEGAVLTLYSTDDWRQVKRIDLRNGWGRGRLYEAIRYLPRSRTFVPGGSRPIGTDRSGIAPSDLWIFKASESFPGSQFQAYPYHPPDLPAVVTCLSVSPDGRVIATGTLSGNGLYQYVTDAVHFLSSADGSLLGAPLDRWTDAGNQQGLEFTADGRFLIVGQGGIRTDHAIRLIDAHTFKIVDVVHAGTTIYDLAVNPAKSEFAVAAGSHIVVWSLPEIRSSPAGTQ